MIFKLEKRGTMERIVMGASVKELDKDALYDAVQAVDVVGTISDIVWLKTIVDSVKRDGMTLTELAPWFSLARRVNDAQRNDASEIEVSESELDLIFERMRGDEFKVSVLQPEFVEFIIEFQEAASRSIR